MNVPSFAYLQPSDLAEASSLLLRHGDSAKIFAGGTDLLVKMKHRRLIPGYLVNIKNIPGLDYIDYEPGEGLRIGALASMDAVRSSLAVRKFYPVLHQAAAYMATAAIRNRATLVGNICNGSPSAETAPALMVLGAQVRVMGPAGPRTVPVEDFMIGPGKTTLLAGEIAVEVFVPEPPPRSVAFYEKHSLRRMDVALVGVAALIVPGEGTIGDVKIALSAVAPTPIRARAAEDLLRGKSPNAELISGAARAAATASSPITDIRARAEARRGWVEELTAKVLRQTLRSAKLEVV